MEFEWDPDKSDSNLRKHGITFLVARQVFGDPERKYKDSFRASDSEPRGLVIGKIDDGRMFTVVFTMRSEVIRIISARRSRDGEQRDYRQSSGSI